MNFKTGFAGAFLVLLAACGGKPVEESTPAVGEELTTYSREISNSVSLGGDGPLVQLFCKNALGGDCPADISDKLKAHGFADNQTGVDLGDTFAIITADVKDGNPDMISTDEDYLWAAYHVAFARDPDESGAESNLTFIKDGGDRKTMLRSLLESQEFKAQQ